MLRNISTSMTDKANTEGSHVNKSRITLFKSGLPNFVQNLCNISQKSLQLAVISSHTHLAY